MHIQRLLTTFLIAALASVACASPAPMPSQKPSGPGWQVVGVKDGEDPYLRVTRVNETQLLVSFGVGSGCDVRNEFMPTFAGFESRGDALVAMVTRTPLLSSNPCVTFKDRYFDVLLDIQAVPASARRIVLGGQACPAEDDRCNGLSAEIPSTPPAAAS